MSLAAVERAIREEATREAQAELDVTRKEAERIVAAAKERVRLERERFDAQTQRLLASMERREIAQANTQSKAIILAQRNEAIEYAFAQAITALEELEGKERQALLEALVARAQREVPQVHTLKCSPRDKEIVEKILPKVKIETDEKMIGGIIASNKENTIRSELTTATLVTQVRERELPSIARALFSEMNPFVAGGYR